MKCKHCGKEIANDSRFCEFCGVKIVKNEQTSECTVHVRWLLLLAMVLVSAANPGFMEYLWDEVNFKNYWDWVGWLLIPILSFIICIPSLVLYIKGKISLIFTILMFGVFALNVVLVAIVGDMESDYAKGYHISFYKGDEIVKQEDFINGEKWHHYTSISDAELKKHIEDTKSSIDYSENDREPYYYEKKYYSYDNLQKLEFVVSTILSLEVLLGILYLICAFIAHRKGLRF